jgi:hypothetical protein
MVVESYTFANFDKEKYMSLTTFRKTGEAVITPVLFHTKHYKHYPAQASNE